MTDCSQAPRSLWPDQAMLPNRVDLCQSEMAQLQDSLVTCHWLGATGAEAAGQECGFEWNAIVA